MSLLSGMNNIFENKDVAMEAEDMVLFQDEIAMEASELIDTIADGENPFKDEEIAKIVQEDMIEDGIINELENDDNNPGAQSPATEAAKGKKKKKKKGEVCPKCGQEECVCECGDCESASEAAAVTGVSFLSSLVLDKNDPIKTQPGSIGQQSSAASWNTNFSDELEDDNDPIKTKPGSVGEDDGTANHNKNFSDASADIDDPIKTFAGSIGQKDSVAKDPAMESTQFLSMLVGNESYVSTPKASAMRKAAATLGIEPLDTKTIDAVYESGALDKVYNMFTQYADAVDAVMENSSAVTKEMREAAFKLKSMVNGSMFGYSMKGMYESALEAGTDPSVALENVLSRMEEAKAKAIEKGNWDSVMEDAYTRSVNFFQIVTEGENCDDPECTEPGSVGQDDSKAHNETNFSGGHLDIEDPVKTKDGAEGQEDSAATFNDNHSGGELDEDDPIHTDDGSVGQKDSTAKDPAAESLNALEELEELTKSIESEIDEDGLLY